MNQEILKKRLLSRIKKTDKGCWEWQGCILGSGYGTLWDGMTTKKVHRIAYELFVGAIPDKLCILHQCDNRACANPEHLSVGTHRQNMEDASNRERFTVVHFFRNPMTHAKTKLNWEKVEQIRALYATKKYNCGELGRDFCVSANNIRSIVTNATWKWKTKAEWMASRKNADLRSCS